MESVAAVRSLTRPSRTAPSPPQRLAGELAALRKDHLKTSKETRGAKVLSISLERSRSSAQASTFDLPSEPAASPGPRGNLRASRKRDMVATGTHTKLTEEGLGQLARAEWGLEVPPIETGPAGAFWPSDSSVAVEGNDGRDIGYWIIDIHHSMHGIFDMWDVWVRIAGAHRGAWRTAPVVAGTRTPVRPRGDAVVCPGCTSVMESSAAGSRCVQRRRRRAPGGRRPRGVLRSRR